MSINIAFNLNIDNRITFIPFTMKKNVSTFNYITSQDNLSLRTGVWLCSNAEKSGTIILLGGRTEFMEKYLETIGELIQRGFDVYSFDWRGQGMSDRILSNKQKGFVKSYDNYILDLKLFIETVVKPDGVSPFIILAHSMGGHIALRFLHEYSNWIDKAVLVSPMVDIETSPLPGWVGRMITSVAMRSGLKHAYAIGGGDYNPSKVVFNGNKRTSDQRRFHIEKHAFANNPGLTLGHVTYNWLRATFKSIDILTNAGYAEKISCPILMVIAGEDKIVSVKAIKSLCCRIPNCMDVTISGARHEILLEIDSIREQFWKGFDRFMQ